MGSLILSVEDKLNPLMLRFRAGEGYHDRAVHTSYLRPGGSGTGNVSLGVNTVNFATLQWWYGFVERREFAGGAVDLLFDCVHFSSFEVKAVPRFAKFYPLDIDQYAGPSVDYVYRDSRTTANTSRDLANLPEDRVNEHLALVEKMLGPDGIERRVLRLKGDANAWSVFKPDEWYLFGVSTTNDSSPRGEMYSYPDAFAGANATQIWFTAILIPDKATRRRLRRVISLDFVRDAIFEPPAPVATGESPVLVLMPGDNEVGGTRWEGWQNFIDDLGPLHWGEPLSEKPVPTMEEEPIRKRKKKTAPTTSTVRPGFKIYEDPPTTPLSQTTSTSTSVKQYGSPSKRKPLADVMNLRVSPSAQKRRTRLRMN